MGSGFYYMMKKERSMAYQRAGAGFLFFLQWHKLSEFFRNNSPDK